LHCQVLHRRVADKVRRGGRLSGGNQRDPDGAGILVVGVHAHPLLEKGLKRRDDGGIPCHATLKGYVLTGMVSTDHTSQVVLYDSIGQSGSNLLEGEALVLPPDQLLMHKDRASISQIKRCPGLKSLRRKIGSNIETEQPGSFLQKRSRACRTNLIHLEIGHPTIPYSDELGVLSPDIDNRVDIWVERNSGLGMSRDFIDGDISPDEVLHVSST
jgi:hypothetical protein